MNEDLAQEELKNLANNFIRLKEKVFVKKPVLKYISETVGKKSVYENALTQKNTLESTTPLARRQELISTIVTRIKNIFGEDIAMSVRQQLETYYYASSIDHHGPICHPFFLNGNLATAVAMTETADSTWNNILVLSCANVSLNNSSFPRGLQFHGNLKNHHTIHNIPFFSAKDRQKSVFGMRPYTDKDLNRLKETVFEKEALNYFSPEIREKVVHIIDAIYGTQLPLNAKDFSEQISRTNFFLWQKFFSPAPSYFPNLLYLDIESLTIDLLLQHHLFADTIISQIIMNRELTDSVLKNFDGISGAFSVDAKSGTYLFWGMPKGEKYRCQLWPQGNKLQSPDGKFSVPLNPESMSEKLQSGELVPSMLLAFMVVSFYYGLKCLGGFSQPSYLTKMKEGYIKILEEIGEKTELEICGAVDTKSMGGDFSLAFLRDKSVVLYQATGLDLVLYGQADTWQKLVALAKKITLEQAINPMLPLCYEAAYAKLEREDALQKITSEQIVAMDDGIAACVSM